MGKTLKLVVCGSKGCGKTSILEQLIYCNYSNSTSSKPQFPHTIEDTYVAHIESERGVKEKVRFYEIGGSSDIKSVSIPKHFVVGADAFVLVYDTTDLGSLSYLDAVKREIEKNKDRKDVLLFLLLGNKKDLDASSRTSELAAKFVNKERIFRHFTVTVQDRQSLIDAFVAITTKITTPPSKSGFPFVKKDPK
ncbi:hypothetical protein BOX15_Mlig001533g1 [Macrostomum lignano]|uniref:NF-kappa-B inhibitor-interacting Ras-like protein n=2 Tax=Macrostomum lignano TaxID=282301 RepID=A0A1I8J7E6_9PLAT|nr:hypothetical protein BOX15_Mlig001533g1 [Macrostomum lignano]